MLLSCLELLVDIHRFVHFHLVKRLQKLIDPVLVLSMGLLSIAVYAFQIWKRLLNGLRIKFLICLICTRLQFLV